MNKVRRKELQEIYDIISEAKERLETVHDAAMPFVRNSQKLLLAQICPNIAQG